VPDTTVFGPEGSATGPATAKERAGKTIEAAIFSAETNAASMIKALTIARLSISLGR
jgi:hypothetical protein